jgi:sec-independent protein translocase protein TatC
MTAHLEELRKRLWVCVGAIAATSTVSFAWAGQLIDWLKQPAGTLLPKLAFFSPPEAVLAYMKVAVTAGLILSMPIVLYEVWAFIRPGLTLQEQRYGLGFVWWGSMLFLVGGAFAYWVLLPVSLQFLLGFGGGQLEPVISIGRYLAFTTMVILASGVVFQLPIAVLMLAKLGIVTPQTLRRKWRHALVTMVVVAAILTPTTDVATMLLMTVPMLALYEISIWVAVLAVRRKRPDA